MVVFLWRECYVSDDRLLGVGDEDLVLCLVKGSLLEAWIKVCDHYHEAARSVAVTASGYLDRWKVI